MKGLKLINCLFVRVFFITLIIVPFKSFAQPANNQCSGAIVLTSSTSCVNTGGTLTSSTYTPPISGCGATFKNDVWYSFVALASTETITLSSAPSQIRIQLFSGTCGSLTSVACGNSSLIAPGLSIGVTYLIRIYSQNNSTGTFNICVTHAPPANDNCAGAVSLTSNTSCVNTASTLNSASATAGLPAGCQPVGTHYDVWFSFVAATTTETVTISSLGANITNPRIQLYSGSCAGLTSLTCGTTTLTNAALTVGNTYYVRVANLGSDPSGNGTVADFNICVTHTAPANDNCAGAISLTSGATCVNTGGTLVGATYTTIPTIGCGVASRNDVWYSFVAVSASSTITLSSAPANPRIQLFSGSCGSLVSVACGTNTLAATGLTAGNTYYVRIYTDPNASGTFNICITHLAPANNDCAGAISLTSFTTCINTAGTLNLSTVTAGLPAGCQPVGNHYDVWYSFVAAATTETITISSLGANITNPRIQLYSGTCAGLTSLTCGTTTLTNAALTIGTTYYVRVANLATDPSGTGSNASFNICITHSGVSNDLCAGAILLTSATSCVNTGGTLTGSTYTTVTGACGTSGGNRNDVWYSFVAQSTSPTITLSSAPANSRIQLFSGTCGSPASLACPTTLAYTASGLTVGTTYLIRVYSNTNATGTFNICITDPSVVSVVDYSKSYINVTKLTTGGSVEPGDVLEIRATFVVRSGTVDSVAFYDTLENNNGFTFLSSTIATQTNEGKIYKAFTDAFDSDAGTMSAIPLTSDTAIRIHMGTGATGTARGTLINTSKPSFYGGTCIIMATYRVQVYAAYNTKINWGGGAISYRDNSTGIMRSIAFKNDSLVVYISPGLCGNSVSSDNKIGIETNGTFNTPVNPAPLARNRGTSAAVPGYIYDIFRVGNGPQDYYYGVANNTSATFSTINTLAKSGSVPQRVFNLWDIIGDHTGATNTAKGNQPCDTTQPVSASNPCGYMLVVNSAYKTDTAFKSSITNLCPNTYYEISAWVRNICYKCGCDSMGRGASSAGYIPFAANDSSGVQPNLAFQINGQDYYTTGNIPYSGTGPGITQQASDSVNQWIKRGFVYKTEATQTSLELLIRNNAPGGGGNDWAIDDISFSTCLPVMTYSPTVNPITCDSNYVTINDTIRSTYENYTNYKWQRSTDDGATWTDISGASGTGTPFWNGSAWEYVASYDIPPSNTLVSDSGDRYRMIVATTTSNLANMNCLFTESINLVTLSVINCIIPLNIDLLSFNGKLADDHGRLYWSTSKEEDPVNFEIEKSSNGTNFTRIASIAGYNNLKSEINYYSFIDPENFVGKSWYRIILINNSSKKKYSRTIVLTKDQIDFSLNSVVNPFKNELIFHVGSTTNTNINVSLLNLLGKPVKNKTFVVYSGINSLSLENTNGLPAGIYILQVKNKGIIINTKVMKK